MSQLVDQLSKSKGLLSAVEAITNRRAFVTLFSTFTAAAILFALFSAVTVSFVSNGQYTLSKITGLIGFIAVFFVVMAGTSATGFLLNDTVRGREQRSISNSLILAATTLPRILGVMAMIFAIGLLLMLFVALILFVCKTPGLGPLLYAVAFPAIAVTLGGACYAAMFVVALHGPAIWEGNSIMRTVAILGSIVRRRLIPVVIQTILLGLLVGLVSSIVLGAIFFGITTTSLLSLPILGQGMGMDMLTGMAGMMGMGGGEGAGYAKAAAFGGALLFGCAIVAPVLVALSGNCIIFLNVTENLSTAELEKSLQGAVDKAREKAAQAKSQLEERSKAAANGMQPAPVTGVASNACSRCGSPTAAGDTFCGNCGNRLS
jgi:hypothetical protein